MTIVSQIKSLCCIRVLFVPAVLEQCNSSSNNNSEFHFCTANLCQHNRTVELICFPRRENKNKENCITHMLILYRSCYAAFDKLALGIEQKFSALSAFLQSSAPSLIKHTRVFRVTRKLQSGEFDQSWSETLWVSEPGGPEMRTPAIQRQRDLDKPEHSLRHC